MSVVTHNAGGQLALGFSERLPCHVHRGRKPMRQWKAGQQRECPARGAKSLLTPADIGEAEVMTPVVWLERHGKVHKKRSALRERWPLRPAKSSN